MADRRDLWAQARGYKNYYAYRKAEAQRRGFRSPQEMTQYRRAARELEAADSAWDPEHVGIRETIQLYDWRINRATMTPRQRLLLDVEVPEMAEALDVEERYLWAIIQGS